MSGILKAIKNLTKQNQKLQDAIKTASDSAVNKKTFPPSSHEMAAQVILNNGLKMPRIGCEYHVHCLS